ncbi:hypothetical protein Tco_0906671 [Tanacetum coccineum]|uniref:Uncharacterized protein n=1 Tax=Tanacetum coccineum TaxID=301880 RepID=A0ABQ5CH44_9ASTR
MDVYMHNSGTPPIVQDTEAYQFKLDKRKFRVDTEAFREILQICPRLLNQDFVEPPSKEELVTFIKELGASFGKTTGLDRLRESRAQILWGDLGSQRNKQHSIGNEITRYCPPSKTAKKLKEIRNFKQEGDETLYQAWEWYNDLLYKCPTHDINSHQKTMVDHSQKWHDGSSRRNIDSSSNFKGIAGIVNKLDSLGRVIKKLKENVHAIQVGCQTYEGALLDKEGPLNEEKFYQNLKIHREAHDKIIQGLETKVRTLTNEVEGRANGGKLKECKAIYTEDGSPLYTPFCYSPKEIEYFSANSGFSDNERQETDKSGMTKALAALEATHEIKKVPQKEKQSVNYHVDPYDPPIPFPRRQEHHTEESLVHKTMESLKKIKINRPLLKEIRQTENYAKHMKDLVTNKPRTEEDEEIRMNPRYGKICKITRERILKDHWREKFRDRKDDIEENSEDPEECREDKANTIIGVIHDKLNADWFKVTSEDKDDLEGILDYLKPRSYNGFIDLDNEAYNKRRCRLLGLTYEEPPLILIEKVMVTRYTIGPEKIYIKVKLLGIKEMPRTRDNVASIRARLMEKMANDGNGQEKM